MLFRETSNIQILSKIFLANCYVYVALNDQSIADSLARIGIKLFNLKWENKESLVRFYLVLGGGDRELSYVLPYLDTAYAIAKANKILDLEQSALINIGTSYAMNENMKEALKYFKLALEIAKERKAFKDLGILYNNLAGLSDDSDEILSYLDSAIYYAGITTDMRTLQMLSENKAYFYYTIGEFENAYDQLWESMTLKDTLLNIQKYGNTTNGTIPLCLWEWEDKLKKGDNIILSAFGGGFTWGSIYIKWAYN